MPKSIAGARPPWQNLSHLKRERKKLLGSAGAPDALAYPEDTMVCCEDAEWQS